MKAKPLFIITLIAAAAALAIIGMQQQQIGLLRASVAKAVAQSGVGSKQTKPVTAAELDDMLNQVMCTKSDVDFLRNMLGLASRLDAAGARKLLVSLAALPLTEKNHVAINILIDRLVRLDPGSALEWANSVPNAHGRPQMLGILFATWSCIDPVRALAATKDIDNPSLRVALTAEVLDNMIPNNPEAAIAALRNLPPGGPMTTSVYNSVFSSWSSVDPAAAAAAALSLPATRNRNFALLGVAQGWASVDPQTALAWSDHVPAGKLRDQLVSQAVTTLAQLNPSAAINYVGQVAGGSNAQQQLTLAVANQWGKDDPLATLEWVEQSMTGQTRDLAIKNLIGPLSQFDPTAAANTLSQIPEGNLQDSAVATLAENWAQDDIHTALEWIQGLPASPNTRNVTANLVTAWASSDPEAATAYVQTLRESNPDMFAKLLGTVADNRESVDPVAAMTWAQSLGAEEGHDIAVHSVIVQLTNSDPQAAWDLALLQPPGDLTDKTLTQVVDKWSAQNPAQAADALAGVSPGNALTSATSQLAQNWLKQDPTAASQWINTLAPGDARNAAVVQLIAIEGHNDLPAAFNWATSISGNAELQNNELKSVIQQWSKKNPGAAAAAVQNAHLTDDQRQSLLNVINNGNLSKS